MRKAIILVFLLLFVVYGSCRVYQKQQLPALFTGEQLIGSSVDEIDKKYDLFSSDVGKSFNTIDSSVVSLSVIPFIDIISGYKVDITKSNKKKTIYEYYGLHGLLLMKRVRSLRRFGFGFMVKEKLSLSINNTWKEMQYLSRRSK